MKRCFFVFVSIILVLVQQSASGEELSFRDRKILKGTVETLPYSEIFENIKDENIGEIRSKVNGIFDRAIENVPQFVKVVFYERDKPEVFERYFLSYLINEKSFNDIFKLCEADVKRSIEEYVIAIADSINKKIKVNSNLDIYQMFNENAITPEQIAKDIFNNLRVYAGKSKVDNLTEEAMKNKEIVSFGVGVASLWFTGPIGILVGGGAYATLSFKEITAKKDYGEKVKVELNNYKEKYYNHLNNVVFKDVKDETEKQIKEIIKKIL